MPGDLRVVFIASPSFSGSTLLATILGAHPEIATVGEMTGPIRSVDVETYLCSCGARIRDCAFWSRVADRMRQKGHPFDVANFRTRFYIGRNRVVQQVRSRSFHLPALDAARDAIVRLWPGHSRDLNALRLRNRAFIESVLEISGKPVFLDASKDPIRIKYLSEIDGLDLKVVHLVRDARATANSFRKNARLRIGPAARRWRRIHRSIERFSAGGRVSGLMTLRYEDLCTDPEGCFDAVSRFAGVGSAPFPGFSPETQHVLGNRMRIASGRSIALDESWREQLTAEQVSLIESIAGRENRRYGYL